VIPAALDTAAYHIAAVIGSSRQNGSACEMLMKRLGVYRTSSTLDVKSRDVRIIRRSGEKQAAPSLLTQKYRFIVQLF